MKTWLLGAAALVSAGPASAQFTAEQEIAFGLNAGRLASDLNLLIAGAIFAVILLSFAAMGYAAYGRWASGRMSAPAMSMLIIRAAVLLMMAGIFLR